MKCCKKCEDWDKLEGRNCLNPYCVCGHSENLQFEDAHLAYFAESKNKNFESTQKEIAEKHGIMGPEQWRVYGLKYGYIKSDLILPEWEKAFDRGFSFEENNNNGGPILLFQKWEDGTKSLVTREYLLAFMNEFRNQTLEEVEESVDNLIYGFHSKSTIHAVQAIIRSLKK